MKTVNEKKKMWGNTKLWSLVLLGAMAALTVDLGNLPDAKADIKVRARVRTPHVDVDFGNHPDYRHQGPRYRGDRYHDGYQFTRITKWDRKVAKRLARYTGIKKKRLLNMRKRGLTWNQIGYRLDIPRRTMMVALHGKRIRGPRYATYYDPYPEPCPRPAPYGR